MSDTEDSPNLPMGNSFCPDCGAVNFPGVAKCYLCGRKFTSAKRAVLPPPLPRQQPKAKWGSLDQPDAAGATARGPNTYLLSTLFMVVTVICVFCGLIASAPGLGIPLAVLVTPALIRTITITQVRRLQGVQSTVDSKIGTFFLSLGLMFLVLIAAGVAFFAACSVVCLSVQNSPAFSSSIQLTLALGAGGCTALAVGAWILIRTWPRTKKNRSVSNPHRPEGRS